MKKWVALLSGTVALCMAASAQAQSLMLDDFERPANRLGGQGSVYVMDPSSAVAQRTDKDPKNGSRMLMLEYDKKPKGGPHDSGGWCGYFTPLKFGSRYFDASPYKTLSFWVRGAQGSENFVVGIADRYWDSVGDSVKSEEIGKYLPAGKITTEWQKAAIPLSDLYVDYKELAAIAICFEGSIFPNGQGKGAIFVDDVVLE